MRKSKYCLKIKTQTVVGKKIPSKVDVDIEQQRSHSDNNRMYQILKSVKSTTIFIMQRTNSLPVQNSPSKKQWTFL